jgi:hypothetical protein
MSIYNNQWIAVDHADGTGYSYIRLQDVDRITIKKTSTPADGDSCSLLLFIQGVEYIYAKSKDFAKAENQLMHVLGLIEKAHGRKTDSPAA